MKIASQGWEQGGCESREARWEWLRDRGQQIQQHWGCRERETMGRMTGKAV